MAFTIREYREFALSREYSYIFKNYPNKKQPRKAAKYLFLFCTEGRNRTGTGVKARGILSPLRLPIPPQPHAAGLSLTVEAVASLK